MNRCIISDYELRSLQSWEDDFPDIKITYEVVARVEDSYIVEVASGVYPMFLDAINYEG